MIRLKARARSPLPGGGTEINFDTTPGPLAANTGNNFNGLGQNGWIPYDAAIAVGPNHVVEMTNAQWAVYSKTGTLLQLIDFGVWWGTTGFTPFDPKCFYDPVGGHFVMLAVSVNNPQAFQHISVSQTSDPTGAWFNYQFDATKDGTTSTSNWSDFPGLGYDDNSIYVTSNQFDLNTNIFQYARLRVLSKTQLYAGQSASYVDFTRMTNADTTTAFTLQPARTLSSSSTEYLLNTRANGGNYVTLWNLTGGPSSPVLTRQATLSVGTYSLPPDADQPGTATLVATNDCRTYDVVWRSGVLHTAWGEAFSGLAAARYLRADTTSGTVLKDITYTQSGTHYYFPAVGVDSALNVYFVFSRSSTTEYASLYQSGMTPSDISIQASALLKAGISSNTSGRWGDYSGVSIDAADSLSIWVAGGWANTSNRWATFDAALTFSGGSPLPTLTSVSPTSGTQGQAVNVTLTGTNFLSGATVSVSGSNVTVSNVNVGSSTQITATFTIAAAAATGSRNVTVTTSVGTSNAVSFTVNAAPVPTLSSVKPDPIYTGSSNAMTLTGTNFTGSPTINFVSATGVSASNILLVNSTTITATFTVAANAPNQVATVTVTTPGGTSNSRGIEVLGPPVLVSLSPNSGDPGASFTVNVNGSNFYNGSTIQVSGTGVTVSNIVKVNKTLLTATFSIAAGAAPGPRNVTVSNTAGTSNALPFTVNGAVLPTISSISPNNGVQGQAVNVTLNGSNFLAGTTVAVSGSGVTVSNTTIVNSGQITATFTIASSATTGAYNVTVSNSAGTSNAVSFTVNPAPPAITSVSPNNGIQGQAVNVTLNGSNFLAGSTVAVSGSGVTVSNTTIVNSGQITATFTIASSATTGAYNVTVSNSAGTSNAVSFTVNPAPPAITSINPNNGIQGQAVNVTLNGSNFLAGSTVAVSGSGVTVSNTAIVNSGQITATFTIASNAVAGAYNVTVSNSAGTSNAVTFTVNAAPVPTLSSVKPDPIFPGGSYTMTLTGTNFTGLPTINFVSGIGVSASNTVLVNSTTITATFTVDPSAPNEVVNVTVTTPGGTSNSRGFEVLGAPVLTSLSPSSGAAGTAFTVNLNGSNFYVGSTIQVSGSGVTLSNVTRVSKTLMTATFTIAAGATSGPRNVTVSNQAGTSNAVPFTVQ